MMNASVALDPDSLMPTYHLTTGVPGSSYAMSVASHLGLPDEIMERAELLLEPQYKRFEDWLSELQGERSRLQARLRDAEGGAGRGRGHAAGGRGGARTTWRAGGRSWSPRCAAS